METTNLQIDSGKRISFCQLFSHPNLFIEIPIIQRDYAQGRKSSLEVRVKFIDALYNYLNENIGGRDLDFVYGSISKGSEKNIFIPLDGQQRLTTLFLLHWYLAVRSGRREDLLKFLASGERSRFTYETRTSAKEFCDALVLENIELEKNEEYKISEIIKNSHWFYLSWILDPTIQSMLIMLDAIEDKFHTKPDFFERLVNLDNPVITFQFLNLNEFQLTDDLYIKMNSRGKPLTSFENFKAKLEQKIKDIFKEEPETFDLDLNGVVKNLSAYEYFSNKIDTVWLNHFWALGGKNPKLIDSQIMNFIRVVLANHYTYNHWDKNNVSARILLGTQDAQKQEGYSDDLSFYKYHELGAIAKDSILELINAFDHIAQINESQKPNLPDKFYFDYDVIINNVFSHNLSAPERLVFYAFIRFLITYNHDTTGLEQWLRVIYNLTENTRIEDAEDLARALSSIEELLPYAQVLLDQLTQPEFKISSFYGRQIQEEKIKACLLLKEDLWSEMIYQAEQNFLLRGQIGFLFEFTGILDYYEQNHSCSWNNEKNEFYLKKFKDYLSKSWVVFENLRSNNEDFLWERTVLTKGDYLIQTSYWRKHLLTTSLTSRDYSWKRLLRLNRESDNDNDILTRKRGYVKEVFDDLRFDHLNFKNSCEQILEDVPIDWRSYFILNTDLFKACNKGFIRFENDLNIKLLTTSKFTYHYELRTYNLYLNKFKDKQYLPFKEGKYDEAYGGEEDCWIYVGNWNFERKEYELNIYFDEENLFGIQFCKSKGNINLDQYSKAIIDTLTDLNFMFDLDMWSGFYKTAKSEKSIMKILNDLCQNLIKLK
jgi:hypothetical protein